MVKPINWKKSIRIGVSRNAGAIGKKNDDHYAYLKLDTGAVGNAIYFAGVTDGVTSTVGGEQASQIAIDTTQQVLKESSDLPPLQRLVKAATQANHAIWHRAQEDPDCLHMSTTLVLAAVADDYLYAIHVGDSRAYLIRQQQAYQLTRDHTWVQEALTHGLLSPGEAATHPNRHVLRRYLGIHRDIVVDTTILDPQSGNALEDQTLVERIPLQAGDSILLCTDGLTSRVKDEEIASTVTMYRRRPQQAVDHLLGLALSRKEPDNITMLLLSLPEAEAAPAPPPQQRRNAWSMHAVATLATMLLVASLIYLLPKTNALTVSDFNLSQAADPVLQTASPAAAVALNNIAPPTVLPRATQTDATLPALTNQAGGRAFLLPTQSAFQAAVPVATETATPVSPTVTPTLTAPPTSTPLPIPSPTATRRPRPTATATPAATPTAGLENSTPLPTLTAAVGVPFVTVQTPPNDTALDARAYTFSWRAVAVQLQPTEGFEVVAWELGQDPFTSSFGLHGPVRAETVNIDLSVILQSKLLQPGKSYQWGVLLVDTTPYTRLQFLGGGHLFRVNTAPSNDSPDTPVIEASPVPTRDT